MLVQVSFDALGNSTGGNRYTYNAPPTTCVGDRVRVPVAQGQAHGTVTGIGPADPGYAGDIKAIIAVLPRETDVVLTVNPDQIAKMYDRVAASGIVGTGEILLLLDDIRTQAEANLGRD